jgi:hypothetical protein
MRLGDYLPTRSFELAVHTVDLATALDVPPGRSRNGCGAGTPHHHRPRRRRRPRRAASARGHRPARPSGGLLGALTPRHHTASRIDCASRRRRSPAEAEPDQSRRAAFSARSAGGHPLPGRTRGAHSHATIRAAHRTCALPATATGSPPILTAPPIPADAPTAGPVDTSASIACRPSADPVSAIQRAAVRLTHVLVARLHGPPYPQTPELPLGTHLMRLRLPLAVHGTRWEIQGSAGAGLVTRRASWASSMRLVVPVLCSRWETCTLDGLLAEHQIAGDLAVGAPGHDVGEDLPFAGGQQWPSPGLGASMRLEVLPPYRTDPSSGSMSP